MAEPGISLSRKPLTPFELNTNRQNKSNPIITHPNCKLFSLIFVAHSNIFFIPVGFKKYLANILTETDIKNLTHFSIFPDWLKYSVSRNVVSSFLAVFITENTGITMWRTGVKEGFICYTNQCQFPELKQYYLLRWRRKWSSPGLFRKGRETDERTQGFGSAQIAAFRSQRRPWKLEMQAFETLKQIYWIRQF